MRNASLKARSAWTILAVYASVALVSLGSFLWVARGLTERLGRRFAEKNVQLDKERFSGPLGREVALARQLARTEAVRDFCTREADPRARKAGLEALEAYRQAFADRSCFLVTGPSGHYYFGDARKAAQAPVETLSPANLDDRWYYAAMDRVDDYALHVDSNVVLGVFKVWVNVVVRDAGRKVGLVGTGVDLSSFLKELVRHDDRSSATVMVDPGGYLQAHPNAAYMEFNARTKEEGRRITFYQLLGSDRDRLLLRERISRLTAGTSQVETFHLVVEGRRYLVSGMALPEVGWVIFTLVDPAQVVGVRTFLPILALMAVGLLVTIALVGGLLNRMVLSPLARLTASSREIAAGRFDQVLPVDRPDEIGQLTETFNHMAGTIRAHTDGLERLVEERTRALTESNRQILTSISYARMIQESTLPKPELIAGHLPDSFVAFHPRDGVGGDFYACLPEGPGLLLAVGDCTGHGVPGAFMGMTASALLSRLMAESGPEDPARLLGAMNRAVRDLLHQDDRSARTLGMDNGLDLGLLHLRARRLVFAGARIPLWIQGPEGGIREHAGDPHSLGYRRSRPDFPFRNLVLELEPGTAVYLFTDGILDQHGGPRSYGFGRRRLAELLESLRGLPMAAQARALEAALAGWKGANPQRDDWTIMGFRTPGSPA